MILRRRLSKAKPMKDGYEENLVFSVRGNRHKYAGIKT
jgi:hypothetical protein